MAGNCSQKNCYPEDSGCNSEGCPVLTDCQFYQINEELTLKSEDSDNFFVRVPWTGSTLGLEDLDFLTSTSQIILIGVAGVASAGKSTFLATLYCLLRHGQCVGDYKFAGSLTLTGWENIAWYLSWNSHNDIQFPPHTTSNSGRIPGLLHISLRNNDGERKEVVFTDAPGEWFGHWTVNKNDVNAAGAQWIHENADAFLLFADCEMLAGAQLGTARKQIRQVADRLKEGLEDRPLSLIWSKSDIEIDPDVKEQISKYITNLELRNYAEFQTSVKNEEGADLQLNVINSIIWLLENLSKDINITPIPKRYADDDLFLSKREK